MTRIRGALALAVAVFVSFPARAAPDTLVVKTADGSFEPGAAVSWSVDGDSVRFKLAEGVDGAAIASLLSERLASAKVGSVGDQLTVEGIPQAALLDQLSVLSLSGASDPLADLGGLGGAVVAMDTPEGGGSIRASKPTGFSTLPEAIKEHDVKERCEAEVLEVKRGTFPLVVLKVKIRRPAKAGALRSKLRRGKILELPIVFAATSEGLDLRDETNRNNLVAYYLEKGDRIWLHAVAGPDGVLEADWITRVKK